MVSMVETLVEDGDTQGTVTLKADKIYRITFTATIIYSK